MGKKYICTCRKATSRVFYGTYEDLINELTQTGEYLKYRKNGRIYVGYEAIGYITEVDSEKMDMPHRKIDARSYFHNIKRKKRITEGDYKRLTEKLNNGELNFDKLYDVYGFVD